MSSFNFCLHVYTESIRFHPKVSMQEMKHHLGFQSSLTLSARCIKSMSHGIARKTHHAEM